MSRENISKEKKMLLKAVKFTLIFVFNKINSPSAMFKVVDQLEKGIFHVQDL